jgi:hypothetical protein
MANIRLGRHEAATEQLPPVCLYCGADAVARCPQRLHRQPGWVSILLLVPLWSVSRISFLGDPISGFLFCLWIALVSCAPYFLVRAVVRQRLNLLAPLCARHRRHSRWRSLGIPLGFLLLAAASVAAVVFLGVWALLAWGLGVVWFILAIEADLRGIQVKEIDEHSFTLARVDQTFADEVNFQHQEPLEARQETPPGSEQFFDPQA